MNTFAIIWAILNYSEERMFGNYLHALVVHAPIVHAPILCMLQF